VEKISPELAKISPELAKICPVAKVTLTSRPGGATLEQSLCSSVAPPGRERGQHDSLPWGWKMPVVGQDQQVIATVGAKAFLTQMVAALQHLALATVDLFTNNMTPSPSDVIGDYHIPDVATEWAEYVQKATTGWGPQTTDASGRVYIEATPLLSWVGPAVPFSQFVYGYIVKSAQAGTPLLYAVAISPPRPVANASQTINLVATFTLPNVQLP